VFERGVRLMPTRWEVEKAVLASDLDAPSRLIMLTLLALSDSDTAIVPEQWGPSLSVLTQKTNLSRATVAAKLNGLESAGWVVRSRPSAVEAWSKKARTQYALHKPTSPGGGLVQEVDQSTSPGDGPELVQDVDQSSVATSPGDGHVVKPTTSNLSQPTTSSSATPPKPRKPRAPRKPKASEPTRLDVEQVCTRLADRIEGNGSKRPAVTDGWRRSARLLLDADGRELQKVLNLIDWCQADSFWKSNVLSMPTFRKQYDRLRLRALDEYERNEKRAVNGGHRPYQNPTDMSVYHGDM
ncbi:MAG TPA: hypothetical protein VIS06_04640, partial [Mycobacteriales bacterium]